MASGKQGRNRCGSTSSPQPHRGAPKQATGEGSETQDPGHLKPKTFLDTGLGGLAPEIRELIFINLLAVPPPFGGRDLRVEQISMLDKSPISLTDLVDLKASCLTVLQTCRQIYFEALPIFYASKSYYLAKSKDLSDFSELGRWSEYGPRSFRFDTITSMCLKDLVIQKPKRSPEEVDTMSSIDQTREKLEAEHYTKRDVQIILLDLDHMRSLRKICLCMRVGQELEYLYFLFDIKGLGRGVVDFVENFHWTIRSQNISEDEWQLQYTSFPSEFYRMGKNSEDIAYRDIRIQEDVLNIDSRASDLDEGDERWVEIDIGSRHYGKGIPEQQHVPGVVPSQELENQQGLPNGNDVSSPLHDGSSYEPGHLLRLSEDGTDHTQADNHTGQEPDDLQAQQYGEATRTTGTQISDDEGLESEDLQVQLDEDNHSPESIDHLDQALYYLQSIEDGADLQIQAESGRKQEIWTLEGQPDDHQSGTSNQTAAEKESDDLHGTAHIEHRNTPTLIESNQELESSVKSTDIEVTLVLTETGPSPISATNPDKGNQVELENWPKYKTLATKKFISESHLQDCHDAQIETDPVLSQCHDAQSRTEPAASSTILQTGIHLSALPILKSPQETRRSVRSPPRRPMATKSLQNETISTISRPKSCNATAINSMISLAAVNRSSAPKAKLPPQMTSHTSGALDRSVRAAALMLALALFYVVMYEKLENMLAQLFALLFSVLLVFVSMGLESD